MVINSSGNVGIGTTTPSAQLTTTGSVRFASLTGAGSNLIVDSLGNVTVSSDERLKNIDGTFNRGLEDIMKINPITYHWKTETGFDTTNAYTGFSAQNMQLAIPEAVATSSTGFLNLADRPIIATLVNAVKELSNRLSSIFDGTANIYGDTLKAKNKLCVDDICVTKEQFRQILLNNGLQNNQVIDTTPVAATTTDIIVNNSSTTTDEVVQTVTPTPIENPVVEIPSTQNSDNVDINNQ